MTKFAVSLLCLMLVSAGYSAYAAAGSLDPAFGSGGKVETGFGIPVIPSTVLLQSTGKIIVVAGFSNTATATESFGVVLYLPYGVYGASVWKYCLSMSDV